MSGLRTFLPGRRRKNVAETGDQPTVRLVAHCRRCHGWLLSPRSVAQGIGPTCAVRPVLVHADGHIP
ncbi:DUF6011 domain-containing protein [Nocardia beijingensis]